MFSLSRARVCSPTDYKISTHENEKPQKIKLQKICNNKINIVVILENQN
jgi:hypothetical protein